MSGTRKQAEKMGAVLHELDSFCAECTHNWACEGCPVDKAKRRMTWLIMETRIQVLGESIDKATIEAMNMPMTHLRLIQGGKRGQ